MRTVEFKLSLNQSQRVKVDKWLAVQRWVWNEGLRLLEDFEAFTAWDKVGKQWIACCPIPWEYYRDSNGQLVPFTRLARTKPYRMACSIPQTYRFPKLKSPTYFGLGYYFAQKNHQDKPWFCEVPSKFVSGTLKFLADAWQEYKSGKRQHPRYKQYKDKIKTLFNTNAKYVRVSGKQISLPKLGKVAVKTLDKRWLDSVPISALKIVKEPSGYYLQLTGVLPTKALKPSNKAVGLATGYRDIYTADGGKVAHTPTYYCKLEKRLARLQRQAARRKEGSANQHKTYRTLTRLHEKIRRSRRAFNHKLSTYLVREYGGITTVKSNLRKITRKPKPIVSKDGKGYDSNGATYKAQINKTFLDKSLGQLTSLIERKASIGGREFIQVNFKDLSDELRQRAEKYHKQLRLPRALYLSSFFGRYRPWGWELTPGESAWTLNQEPPQSGPPCDAGTASNSTLEKTDLHGFVNSLETTSAPHALNQQKTKSSFDECRANNATSQNF